MVGQGEAEREGDFDCVESEMVEYLST